MMFQPGAILPGPMPSGGLDLRGVLEMAESLVRTAWRRRRLVLLLLALGPAGAALYLCQATPQYAGSARLYVEAKGPKIITEQEGVLTQAKNYVHTQAELIKSSSILQSVVDDPALAGLDFFDGAADKIKRLKNAMSVSVGRNDEIISVTLRAEKAAEAELLVDRIVKAYIAYHTTCKKNTATDVLRLLQQEKTQCETDLRQKLQDIVNFNQHHDICNLSEDNLSMEWQRLSKFSSAITQAQLDMVQAKTEYDRLEDALMDPNQATVYLDSLRSQGRYMMPGSMELRLAEELETLYQQRRSLRRECTPEHPALREIDALVTQAEMQLQQVKRDIIAGAVNAALRHLQQAQGVSAALKTEVEQQRQDVRKKQEHTAQWTMLQSEVKRLERACDILDGRIKEMDLTEEAGVYNITIVEPAQAGIGPVSPNRLMIMAGGSMLGLMMAIGLIVLLDFTDGRLRRADDVVNLLRTPLLGALPKLADHTPLPRLGQWVRLEEQSLFTQTIKEIRAALMYDRRRVPFRTVLITSPGEGEGKSIFASNLALALTQGNKRVLLVDAQGKNPVCHDIFLHVNQQGLRSVLEEGVDPINLVQPTACPRLEVLTHGPKTPVWSELLESPRFSQFLAKMRLRYDYVIIDGPAASPGAEAAILAAGVDAALVVLHAGKTTRQACRRLAQRFGHMQIHMLGAVMNALDGRRHYFEYSHPVAATSARVNQPMPMRSAVAAAPSSVSVPSEARFSAPMPIMPAAVSDEFSSTVCTTGMNSPVSEQVGISHQGGVLRTDPDSTYASTITSPTETRVPPEAALERFLKRLTQLDEQLAHLDKKLSGDEEVPGFDRVSD